MEDALREELESANEEKSTEQQGTKAETEEESTDQQEKGSTEIEESNADKEDNSEEDAEGKPKGSEDIVDLNNEEEKDDSEDDSEKGLNKNPVKEILDGEFEDEDDLKGYIETLESKIDEFEKNGSKPPEFANDFVKKLNDHVANGGKAETFIRVQGVNVDEMNSVERLTTEIMWNNPDFSKEDAIKYLKRKFPDSLNEDEELDPNDPVLRADGNKAAQFIKEKQAEDITPSNSVDGKSKEDWEKEYKAAQEEEDLRFEKEEEQRMSEWIPSVDKAVENVQKEGILIPIGNSGKAFRFKFESDDKYIGELKDRVEDSLKSIGLTTKENPKMAEQLLQSSIILDKIGDIVKSYGDKVENFKEEEWFVKMNNPSALKRGDKPNDSKVLPSASDALASVMEQH